VQREEFEHVIRAAADAVDEDEIVVVGSQAILGQFPQAPELLVESMEADVYPAKRPEAAEDIDAAIGDGSVFHETFGYYAHGVGPETAKAPAGWETRLVRVQVASRVGGSATVTALCLEAHDLVLAKCAAGRERDWAFAREAIRAGLVDPNELRRRAGHLPVSEAALAHIEAMLRAISDRSAGGSG
jgi:hypothetical protein